jgi:trehalose 6-phosphate synthase/phosphatase
LLNVLIVGTNITDVEFGRVQARDMLQHLWTGPISNAAVDVVQGSKSVEVRPVGVSKVILYLNIYT